MGHMMETSKSMFDKPCYRYIVVPLNLMLMTSLDDADLAQKLQKPEQISLKYQTPDKQSTNKQIAFFENIATSFIYFLIYFK